MDVMDKIQKISEIGKSTREKQKMINVSEVFYVWDILVTKLDILDTMNIVKNYIKDSDLKYISNQLVEGLNSGLPFPVRPPVGSNTTVDLESFTDRYIYQNIFEGIQSFFPILSSGFMNSTSPKVRKAFKNHLLLTIELQELIVEYGYNKTQ
jgi:spore coat protein CotF